MGGFRGLGFRVRLSAGKFSPVRAPPPRQTGFRAGVWRVGFLGFRVQIS